VSAITAILRRLDAGRPVIFSGDPVAALGARGIALDGPAPLGQLLREAPAIVAEHYEHEIAAGVDVLCALTAHTSSRALARIGMSYRAAALTGTAVDLACEAADRAVRPVAVAGLLGAHGIGPLRADRIGEDYAVHAARLAAAGCELLVARGFGADAEIDASFARLARRAAVVAASSTQLSTWAHVDVLADGSTDDGEPLEACVAALAEAGATVLVLDVPDARVGLAAIERTAGSIGSARLGVFVADAEGVTRVGRADVSRVHAWAADVKRFVEAGARVVGGGLGTTPLHTAAIAKALGRTDPTSIWPRAV